MNSCLILGELGVLAVDFFNSVPNPALFSIKLRPSMNWVTNLIWHNGKFLGIDLSVWKVVGWLGNVIFFSRFLVQWYATEKKKAGRRAAAVLVVESRWFAAVSVVFDTQRDSVFIFAYAFTWIPYIRNLMIHRRTRTRRRIARVAGKIFRRSRIFARTAA